MNLSLPLDNSPEISCSISESCCGERRYALASKRTFGIRETNARYGPETDVASLGAAALRESEDELLADAGEETDLERRLLQENVGGVSMGLIAKILKQTRNFNML